MSNQLDNPNNIALGEIAIKARSGEEAFFIQNLSGEICSLPFSVVDMANRNKNDIISLSGTVEELIRKSFIMNLSVGITTSLIEEGKTGDAYVTFSVSGDVDNSDCVYKMYIKEPNDSDYRLYRDGFTEAEVNSGRVSVSINTTTGTVYFKIIATSTGSIEVSRTGTTNCSHAYMTLYGATNDNQITQDTLSSLSKSLVAKKDFRMDFGGPYYDAILIIAVPKSYGHLRSIKDDNKFEYIQGYTENSVISGNYYVYIKNTQVTNTGTSYCLTISY